MLTRLRNIVSHLPRSATMSTTVHNTNKACCSIPPVQSDYQPKGLYKPVGNFQRVYVTGPQKSANAIVCVYDIFGFFPQTQQGADILASALNTTVYMPDFFEPNRPFPIENLPPKTEGEKGELQAFFGSVASPPDNVKKLVAFGQALKTQGVNKIGVYGFCWGGKVTIVASGENTPFDAAAIVHPAMLSVEDAQKLTIPFAIYISKDESVPDYEKIVEVLSQKPFAAKNDHKYYPNMFHGWAAARADLKKEDNRVEFDNVYGRLVEFFGKNLA